MHVKITLGSVKIPDIVHLRLVYSAGLGQSKEEREEEKTSYMRLRDYFEKSRHVRVTDGCR